MKYISGTKIVDHTGKAFGDIHVDGFIEKVGGKHPNWDVHCTCCGRVFTMQSTHLKNKKEGEGCGYGCSERINEFVHVDERFTIVDISTETFPDKFTLVLTEDYNKYMKSNRWYVYRAPHSLVYYCYSKQDNKRVALHRVINGTPDSLVTDHIDGNGLNNLPNNLRSVTCSENQRNITIPVNNRLGFMGVYKRTSGRWSVTIKGEINVQKHLGTFDTSEEAIEIRKSAEFEYGYHKNHGRTRGSL